MKNFLSKCKYLVFCVLFCNSAFAQNKNIKPELVIYTYESFVSKWGPGPDIQQAFESECNCKIKWINSDDGAAILTRLRLEGKNSTADVVIGLDENIAAEAESTKLFEPYAALNSLPLALPIKLASKTFIPFDFGWFAFMVNTEKIKNPPKSMDELLNNPLFKKSLLIQDPTTSTPGLGLLLWIQAIYGKNAPAAYKKLATQTLTVAKGWSESYGLFTKGEAPFVLSYTTSEAYHRTIEKTTKYKALIFSEGHYPQVELAGLIAASHNKDLAKKFLNFIFDLRFQKAVTLKNWMYPVIPLNSFKDLPQDFINLKQPITTLSLPSSLIFAQRKQWINTWRAAYQ